ncbi:hypothetical protein LPU83_pLPU83c_0442 (plasmid) [Rhizobium favelukesii]|uniref:Uncharacterized protein n=1 Tax=Rhizobium favelukesii TaxID=348824 RepID=W6RJJ7_9HYPH|nr:hypothetical protein LPU83_pLPU83c_0442 [Rhizobium favelukesii]
MAPIRDLITLQAKRCKREIRASKQPFGIKIAFADFDVDTLG